MPRGVYKRKEFHREAISKGMRALPPRIRMCKKCGVELTKDNSYLNQTSLLCKKHWIEFSFNSSKRHGHVSRKRYLLKYDKTPKRKKKRLESAKRMYEKYTNKWIARAKARYAVKTGRIIKLPCVICKNPKTEGHHEDYNKPLELIWLCKKHHTDLHFNRLGKLINLIKTT